MGYLTPWGCSVTALERIRELEEQLQDAHILIDLLQEDNAELREREKVLKGQVFNLLQDRRYPDLAAG